MAQVPDVFTAADHPERGRSTIDPHDFLAFLEANVTPADLIADRVGQAALARVLDQKFYTGERVVTGFSPAGFGDATIDREARGLIKNPAPEITLERQYENGRGATYIRDSFRLLEPPQAKHHYFFRLGNPLAAVPDFLRPQDVVPSDTYTWALPAENLAKLRAEQGWSDEEIEHRRYIDDPLFREYCTLVDIPFNKPLERVRVLGGEAELYNYNTEAWQGTGELYQPSLGRRLGARVDQLMHRSSAPPALPAQS